jgi:uncharacterized membrane protein
MVWLQSVLLYLHIIGAIFWFGSSLFLEYVIMPVLVSMQFEAQKPLLMGITARFAKVIPAVGGLTILFGILRGIATGVLGSLGSAYGLTYLASIVVAVVLMAIGAALIGPNVEKMAAATTREDVIRFAGIVSRNGSYATVGFLVILVLMVAMRAGY